MSQAVTVENIQSTRAAEPFVRRPGAIERIAAMAMLFVFAFSLPTEWFVRVSTSSARAVQGGSPLTTVVFLGFFGVVAISFNGNWHLALAAVKREPLLAAMVGTAVLSVVWSVNIFETLSAGVVLIITFAVGLYFSVRYRLEETLLLAGYALAVGVVANYAFIFVFQQFGLDTINVGTDGGSKWSGVFVTKNELGRTATLSFFIFLYLARNRRSFIWWPMWAFLALIQIVASDSATSLGATGGLLVLVIVFLGFRGRKTLYGATALAMITTFSALTLMAATNLAAATGLLGKNSNFTGRLPLWENSVEFAIAERPWFGYGWLAFWDDRTESMDVIIRSDFDVPHAHNAFLDAWIYVGVLGPVLLAAIFVRSLIWGARNIRGVPSITGLVPIMMVSYALIFSLTEAGVFRRDISFVLFVTAVTVAAKNKGRPAPYIAQRDPTETLQSSGLDVRGSGRFVD